MTQARYGAMILVRGAGPVNPPTKGGRYMGRSAMSKLGDARELDKEATRMKKGDPEAAERLSGLARKKRRAAIRQLNRAPRRRTTGATGAGRELHIG